MNEKSISSTMVFSCNGKRATQANTKAWLKTLKQAGIENSRWPDLRHTCASWHLQEGTLLHLLQELGGWSLPEMVQKYAYLSSEHLSQLVDRRPTMQSGNVVGIDRVFATGSNQVAGLTT